LLARGPTGALIYDKGAEASLRCRAVVASTLLAGLELARSGIATLEQDTPCQPIHVSRGERQAD